MSKINISDITIKDAIVHILDSTIGNPILSESILQFGSDFSDFLKQHIYKVVTSDEAKECQFIKSESDIYTLLQSEHDFVRLSQVIAKKLYGILNSNIDIPSADLIVVEFELNGIIYLALLKMNYKESYMHQTKLDDDNNVNDIIKYRAMLPSQSQKLSEAAIINLNNYSLKLLEKKYDINGQKVNYLSEMFLVCTTNLSQKSKLTIVEKAIDAVQKEFFTESEQCEEQMKVKSSIHNCLSEHGQVNISDISTELFGNKANLREKFIEKLDKYGINGKDVIKPTNESTINKYDKQKIVTDTGIEIKVPMGQYSKQKNIEFITNNDGTISILIKNVGKVISK